MTMATKFYPSAKVMIATGSIDCDTDTFKMMLVTDAYTPSDAHDFRNDVTNEVSGTGYTAGGATLTGVTCALSGTEARWDCNDPSWSTATFTARGGVIYKSRGGASSADELVCALTFGADIASTGGAFTVQIDSTGFAAMT